MRPVLEIVTDLVFAAAGVWSGKGPHRANGETSDLKGETAWHFGFYSRPKDGARGVVLKMDGQGNTSFLVGYRDKQYELSLEKGEVGAKNAFDAYWLLNQAGVLELNGTTYAGPKWDDFLSDLSTALGSILASNSGGNIVSDALVAIQVVTNKIAANAYNSDKVKLG